MPKKGSGNPKHHAWTKKEQDELKKMMELDFSPTEIARMDQFAHISEGGVISKIRTIKRALPVSASSRAQIDANIMKHIRQNPIGRKEKD